MKHIATTRIMHAHHTERGVQKAVTFNWIKVRVLPGLCPWIRRAPIKSKTQVKMSCGSFMLLAHTQKVGFDIDNACSKLDPVVPETTLSAVSLSQLTG